MKARIASPLARRAEEGALRPQRICLSIGEPGGRTTRATPLLLGQTEGGSRRRGKTVRLITLFWKVNYCSDLQAKPAVSRARSTASTQLLALSRHEKVCG